MTDIKTLEAEALGMSIWLVLDDDQKAVIKFGMTPVEIVEKFESVGITDSRTIALAMMKAADVLGGGMVV